jgi:hypothetical protein
MKNSARFYVRSRQSGRFWRKNGSLGFKRGRFSSKALYYCIPKNRASKLRLFCLQQIDGTKRRFRAFSLSPKVLVRATIIETFTRSAGNKIFDERRHRSFRRRRSENQTLSRSARIARAFHVSTTAAEVAAARFTTRRRSIWARGFRVTTSV